jgi:hypothetical protein
LRSSTFKAIGKFGIGFYAIFMVAKAVVVSSRRYTDGLNDIRTLHFPQGLTLRPTLSAGSPKSFSTNVSTRITITLNDDHRPDQGIMVTRGRLHEENFSITFADYLATLACGLDVDVDLQTDEQTEPVTIHFAIHSISTPASRENWLKTISYESYGRTKITGENINSIVNRLRYIDDDNPSHGLAALSITLDQNNLSAC